MGDCDMEGKRMHSIRDRSIEQPPLVLNWGEPFDPLPLQEFRGPVEPGSAESAAPPWWPTGPLGQPFDFCAFVRRLCDDIALRSQEFAHIRTDQVLFAVTKARNGRIHGLQARVTPLRFRGGGLVREHRAARYQVQRHVVAGREMLYLMTFCLPRFLNQPFDDKLVTIFHELYHIGPAFDGDLRRHTGRCSIHTRSRRGYDERMAELARTYLASGPDPDLHAFLRLEFRQLRQRHGSVIGVSVPRPKLVPLICETAACTAS